MGRRKTERGRRKEGNEVKRENTNKKG